MGVFRESIIKYLSEISDRRIAFYSSCLSEQSPEANPQTVRGFASAQAQLEIISLGSRKAQRARVQLCMNGEKLAADLRRVFERHYPDLVRAIRAHLEEGLTPERVIEEMTNRPDITATQLSFVRVSARELAKECAGVIHVRVIQ